MAFRPKTLGVAAVPVVVAAFWVFAQQSHVHVPTFILMTLCAILFQVITNLQNDVGYTQRNADPGGARVGMPRATALNLLTEKQVKNAIKGAIALALFLSIPLIYWHGWIVAVIGALSIITAIWYMAGKHPLAFTPYGEVFVFIFFGLIAVNGAVYVLTHEMISFWTLLLSVAIGSLASSVLLVNNYRDLEHDQKTGRRTLAVFLGRLRAQKVYAVLIFAPFVITLIFASNQSTLFLLPLFSLPFAVRTFIRFKQTPLQSSAGDAFNHLLVRTVTLEVFYGALFCVAALVTGILKTSDKFKSLTEACLGWVV